MTQLSRLMTHMETHDGVTTLEAMHLGICRLSERVRELEALQYHFTRSKEKTANGATVVRYRLSADAPSPSVAAADSELGSAAVARSAPCTKSDYQSMRG